MVFLFHLDASLATTYSLFIVGLTSLFGSFKQIKEKRGIGKKVEGKGARKCSNSRQIRLLS